MYLALSTGSVNYVFTEMFSSLNDLTLLNDSHLLSMAVLEIGN
jgi:hypothetical protein